MQFPRHKLMGDGDDLFRNLFASRQQSAARHPFVMDGFKVFLIS